MQENAREGAATTLRRLLTTKQAAELLGLAAQSLENDRVHRRIGLPYIKIGAAVRYREADLIAFIEARAVPAAA